MFSLTEIFLKRFNQSGSRIFASSLIKFSASLTERLLTSRNFDQEVGAIIQELRSLGHDLYLFDSDFDVDFDADESSQLWTGDWTQAEGQGTPLILTFHSAKGVKVSWGERAEKNFQV